MQKKFQRKEENLQGIFKFREYSVIRWCSFFFAIEALVVIGFIIYTAIPEDGELREIWFGSLQYFTQQSNFMVCLFLILYWINPSMKIFRRNRLLIIITSYITFTFIGYNFLILPGSLILNISIFVGNSRFISTIFLHVINPICMIALFSLICHFKAAPINTSRLKTVVRGGMVYPCVYILYAVILPFITDESVYGPFTNLNPNFVWTMGDFSMAGTPWAGVFFAGAVFAFAGMISLYWKILTSNINLKKIYQMQ